MVVWLLLKLDIINNIRSPYIWLKAFFTDLIKNILPSNIIDNNYFEEIICTHILFFIYLSSL